MGCDIHTWAVDKNGVVINGKGKWVEYCDGMCRNASPFEDRCYRLFGWLGDVRNYSGVTPIAPRRGWPNDLEGGEFYLDDIDHSHSWVSVDELNKVDYGQVVEDRRVIRLLANGIYHGGCTCDHGEGETMTLRDFLGEDYFKDLYELNRIGADRVIFCFAS